MIYGNISDFIDCPLHKHFVSAHGDMGPPTTPGPQVPYHLNPVLGRLTVCLFFGTLAVFPNSRFDQYLFLWFFYLRNRIMTSTHPLVKLMQ